MERKQLKVKPNAPKKNLIRTKSESNRLKIMVTIAILLVAAIAYYLIDTGSYVATVDGNRISKYEYQFFLSQTQAEYEQKEGLYSKTEQEKKDYWAKVTDGQNQWDKAKRDALETSKDYMVQLIKANEMGKKVDSDIKNEIDSFMASLQADKTDKEFSDQIKEAYKMSVNEFKKVTANLMLIDEYKAAYLSKQYTAKEISDNEIKAYYDKDHKKFDQVDISYILLSKYDEKGEKLPKDQLDAKMNKAEEALDKIKKGELVDKVIANYTEAKPPEGTSNENLGKAKLGYSQNAAIQSLIDYVFDNKPGDAGIVDTEYFIYVVKIENRTAFEDVKATIKTTMQNEEKEAFYENALQTWRLESRYNIIKNNRVYDSFSYR